VAALAEAQSIGERYGIGWALAEAAEVRAEIDGHGEKAVSTAAERRRPVRALTARSGRRALSALVGRLDATELERRFADPRRQRALLTAMARGFQPSQADGFEGVIVFELEPHEIEPPADGFWRWAVEIDSAAGHARLLETAPLAAAMTLRIGMGEWVRVLAGIENALEAVAGGRATIDGDVALAIRLEGMFGG
jgi:hypothetical protein